MSLNAKIALKQAAKRNKAEEQEIKNWIEEAIGEKFDSAKSYEDNLKNGVFLCRLMNKLEPGSVRKIETKGGDFILRQNIDRFQKAAKNYGLATELLFQTADLFEKKNIPQVTACLHELSRISRAKGFSVE